jgi:hypothetical protein
MNNSSATRSAAGARVTTPTLAMPARAVLSDAHQLADSHVVPAARPAQRQSSEFTGESSGSP